MSSQKDLSEREIQLQAELAGYFWKESQNRLTLLYRPHEYAWTFCILLLFIGVLLIFASLMAPNPGAMQLHCERRSGEQGSCWLQRQYLHPFLFFLNSSQQVDLNKRPELSTEEVGGRGRPLRLNLHVNRETWSIWAASETEVREDMQLIQQFLSLPEQTQLDLQHFDTPTFVILYLPFYLLLGGCLGLFLLQSLGLPWGACWLILDGAGQKIFLRHTVWGWPLTQQRRLQEVSHFDFAQAASEKGTPVFLKIYFKKGDSQHLTLPLKDPEQDVLGVRQQWIIQKLNQSLKVFQNLA